MFKNEKWKIDFPRVPGSAVRRREPVGSWVDATLVGTVSEKRDNTPHRKR